MAEAGQGQTAQLVVDDYGPDTAATVTVYTPARAAGSPITATTEDDGHTWLATIPPGTYTAGGRWWLKWTITGAGEGSRWFPVDVGPARPVALRRAYATTTDLANYLDDVPPADAEQLLVKATRILDRILKCAVYPVDGDGEPTEAEHIEALRDACCQLAVEWDDIGDPDATMATLSSASAGSISLGRAGDSKKRPRVHVGDQVEAILDGAGLLGHQPYQQ